MPRRRENRIAAEVVLDRSLVQADRLDLVQRFLIDIAPHGSSQLRIWREPGRQILDAREPGALLRAFQAQHERRLPFFRALDARHGMPGNHRLLGDLELRGAWPGLRVSIDVDEYVVGARARERYFANKIVLEATRPRIAGRPCSDWMRAAFEALCRWFSPAWGAAGHGEEWWAKVVIADEWGISAHGRDFGRFLPGVFWLNYIGNGYRELFGDERLQSVPAPHVASLDHGVLFALGPDPWQWDTPEYAKAVQRVRRHLGSSFFFSKARSTRNPAIEGFIRALEEQDRREAMRRGRAYLEGLPIGTASHSRRARRAFHRALRQYPAKTARSARGRPPTTEPGGE